LIGLTATPFRGGVDETRRLVTRFGGQRLDSVESLGGDAYRTLQELGVLARVEHSLLAGAEIDLTEDEKRGVETLGRLPASVEDRLSRNVSRNRALVDAILRLPDDWPVLLFGTSVEHAQTISALLRLEGVKAAAIWGQLEPGARRHYIEQFRKGGIRVLTNYQVLTAGFDAPQVRAIVVARPTYSAALYQQMIGRGLRGPRNGGKDTCLIVNVADNIRNYGQRLAFTEFEYLWRDSEVFS
jgi:superfamily II DNA or RNA helicase